MTPPAWQRALTDPGDPALRRLPHRVETLLIELAPPARLVAHLRAVHDVAGQLLDWVQRHHPEAAVDRAAVLFGAATHDIGKIEHPAELSGPGSAHEQAGRALLQAHGVEPDLARFARTHASWTAADITIDDLLVSLADKIWKAKRVPDLEQLLTDQLATAAAQPSWQVYMALDDECDRIAANAGTRLSFQALYPIA